MITGESLGVGIALVYGSLCIGVYYKFQAQGVRGTDLLYSLFMPFSVLVIAAFGAFKDSMCQTEGGYWRRIHEGCNMVYIAYRYFPVLVGLTAVKLQARCQKRSRVSVTINQLSDVSLAGLYNIRAHGLKAQPS